MEEIYSVMFEKIISGEYPAGIRLKQEDIAKEFNISRTPVRIVLQQLDQDGLVQLTPNKGARVLPFSADEIEEIYEIRKSLELLCLEISAPLLSMQKLLELKKDMVENLHNDDVKVLADLDARLHSFIIDSSRKKRLIHMLNQLFRLLQRFRSLGYLQQDKKQAAMNEHIGIIDALSMRDIAAAKELMKNHIDNSKINALSQVFRTE